MKLAAFCFSKKTIFFGTVISSLFASQAFGYGTAGCGLGSIIFESDNTWWKQVLAATTNGTSGNQTFGITSGTSNCGSGASAQVQKQKDFVAANLSTLQREIAQGTGDALNGFAAVFGCKTPDYNDFGAYSQSKYNAIFNSNDPNKIVINVKSEILKDSKLSNSCEYAHI